MTGSVIMDQAASLDLHAIMTQLTRIELQSKEDV